MYLSSLCATWHLVMSSRFIIDHHRLAVAQLDCLYVCSTGNHALYDVMIDPNPSLDINTKVRGKAYSPLHKRKSALYLEVETCASCGHVLAT